MGYCLWWLLGKCWCYCGVSTAGILHSRLAEEYQLVMETFVAFHNFHKWSQILEILSTPFLYKVSNSCTRTSYSCSKILKGFLSVKLIFFFCQQMQSPSSVVLTLVLVLVQSTWMRLAALAMRLPSSAVLMHPTNNSSVDMGTGRMLE